MKKITISFKSTKRDEALYNVISQLDEKSFYIKEALRQYFKEEIQTELQKLEEAEKNSTIDRRQKQQDLDFEDRRQSGYKYDEILEEIKQEE